MSRILAFSLTDESINNPKWDSDGIAELPEFVVTDDNRVRDILRGLQEYFPNIGVYGSGLNATYYSPLGSSCYHVVATVPKDNPTYIEFVGKTLEAGDHKVHVARYDGEVKHTVFTFDREPRGRFILFCY